MNPNGNPQPPQKLLDFNADLKALCERYQYELRATLSLTPDSTAIVATMQAFDVSPKIGGIPLQTETPPAATPETPKVETLDNKPAN